MKIVQHIFYLLIGWAFFCGEAFTQSYSTYAYRLPITLNTTSLGLSANLTNFPMLLQITDPSLVVSSTSCTNKVQFPNGPNYDFAFVDPIAGELNYQVESYNPATGTLLVWVNMPTVNIVTNNTLLFYFGNATAPATHTTTWYQATWSGLISASSPKAYNGVWHFSQTPSTTSASLSDATSAGNNLIAHSSGVTQNASSIIGSGIQLASSNVSAAITGYPNFTTPLSISVWAKYSATPATLQNMMVLFGTTGADQLGYRNSAQAAISTYGGAAILINNVNTATGWHDFVYSYNGITNSLYIDGVLQVTSTNTPQNDTPVFILFGDYVNSGSSETFSGYIDEARVINTALTADWIKAEYKNQSSPTSYITVGSIVADPANVGSIPGGVIYTYNGSGYTPNVSGVSTTPANNGNESFIIATSTSPTATTNDYSLTINSGVIYSLNGQIVNVGCNLVNNGSISSAGTSSTLVFNGTGSAQSYTGTTSGTAQTGNIIINNSAAGTVTITGGGISLVNTLTLSRGNLAVNNSGNGALTLLSTGTQTASVAAIPSGSSISGQVNVQRFFTGGNSAYRGYRLLSSPVNLTTTSGAGNIGLSYINTTTTLAGTTYYGALTGGPGSGFSVANPNPTMYVYNESIPSSNVTFTSGKSVGIYSVGSASFTTLSKGVQTPGVTIPAGNGYFFYFIGDNHISTTAQTRIPENTITTATGYINQGNIPLTVWNTGSTSLSYASVLNPGYNMVGNPYPCTIDLNKVYTDNGSLYPIFYELNNVNPSQNFNSYNAGTGAVSGSHASRYVASGQGFFVKATAAGQTLTFKEDQKVPAQQVTTTASPFLLLALRTAEDTPAEGVTAGKTIATKTDLNIQNTPVDVVGKLHLRLNKDSLVNEETGLYFNSSYADNFDKNDAAYLQGINQSVYLYSLTTEGVNVCINSLSDYFKGKEVRLFVKAAADGIYNLQLTDIQNIDTALYNIFVADHFTGDSINMVSKKTYPFTISKADTTTFGAGRFVLAVKRKVLPNYYLASFTAQKAGNGVLLAWKTGNEGSYTGFAIEKQDGNDSIYTTLYNVQSNGKGKYSYIDNNPATGNNTYRLAQNNIDNLTTYTNPVNILYNAGASPGFLSVYPNPAKDVITVNFNRPVNINIAQVYLLSIYNSTGGLELQLQISNNSLTKDLSFLKPGGYMLVVKDSAGSLVGNTKFTKYQ